MKKTLCAILALTAALSIPTFAAADKFAETFFPDGKLDKPASAPFVYYFGDVYDEVNGDFLYGYFDLPADIRHANEIHAKHDDITAFDEAYGTDYGYEVRLQLDSKMDDGAWLYTDAWDTAVFDTDMNVKADDLSLDNLHIVDNFETNKRIKWCFSELRYLDANDFENSAGWAAGGIYSVLNEYGDPLFHFDFENHTFSYRYRYLICYSLDGEDEARFLLSDWSDTTSIGKNGTQQPAANPTVMPAPSLSEFEVRTDNEGNSFAEYYMDIPMEYYLGQMYHNCYIGNDDPYLICCEMKVNGTDWVEIEVGNATWLLNGYRSLFYDELNIKTDDAIQIRTRMMNLTTGEYSPYSNVIGTVAFEASDWALPYLNEANTLGLIPDCLVGEDLTKQITRKEFAAVCVKLYESLAGAAATPVAVNPFTDCADAEVLKALNVGITAGTSDTTFEPDVILNREQAATMLTRVFKKVTFDGWTLATDGSFNAQFAAMFEKSEVFDDDADIDDWAKDSVYFMKANGIINGVGGNLFAPKHGTTAGEAEDYGLATREQALKIAVGMVQNLG